MEDASHCSTSKKDREERMKMVRERQLQEQERRQDALKEAQEKEERRLRQKELEKQERAKKMREKEDEKLKAVLERRKRLEAVDREKRQALMAKYRAQSENRGNQRADKNKPVFAFGSSTPRVLAYLENLQNDQKLYNTKLVSEPLTNEELEALSSSTAMTASFHGKNGASFGTARAASALAVNRIRGSAGTDSPGSQSSPAKSSTARDKSNSLPTWSKMTPAASAVTSRLATPRNRGQSPLANASMSASVHVSPSRAKTQSVGPRRPQPDVMTQSFTVGELSVTRNPRRKTPTRTLVARNAANSNSKSTAGASRSQKPKLPGENQPKEKSPKVDDAAGKKPPRKGVTPPAPGRRQTPAKKTGPQTAVEGPKPIQGGTPSPPGTPPDQKRMRSSEERTPPKEPERLTEDNSVVVMKLEPEVELSELSLELPPRKESPMELEDQQPPDNFVQDSDSDRKSPTSPLEAQPDSPISDPDTLADSESEMFTPKVARGSEFRVETVPIPTGNFGPQVHSEEEARVALAEKRRLAREAKEREQERQRQIEEEERRAEEERIRLEEEEFRRQEVEELQLMEQLRRDEQERLARAIEEEERRKEEERRQEEEERERKRLEEEEAGRERERIEQELRDKEEKFKREQQEREERKKRLELIKNRARLSGANGSSPQATPPSFSASINDPTGTIFRTATTPGLLNGNHIPEETPPHVLSSSSASILQKLAGSSPALGNLLSRHKSNPQLAEEMPADDLDWLATRGDSSSQDRRVDTDANANRGPLMAFGDSTTSESDNSESSRATVVFSGSANENLVKGQLIDLSPRVDWNVNI